MPSAVLLESAILARALAELRIGPSQSLGALTLWPLLQREVPRGRELRCARLAEALEDGCAGVEGARGPGGDPEVRVENRGCLPLLILWGEEIGAERGGCAAASVLVRPKSEARLGITPLDERRRPVRRDLLGKPGEFPCHPGQIGFAAGLGNAMLGLEVLGTAAVFARAFRELAANAWLDAVASAFRCGGPRRAPFQAPEPLLEALARAGSRTRTSPGWGREIRLQIPGLQARALAAGGELVHLGVRPPRTAPGAGRWARPLLRPAI